MRLKQKKSKKPYVPPEVKTVEQPGPKGEDPSADGAWISKIGGRKFVLVYSAMIAVVVIGCVRGDIPTKDIIDTLMVLAGIGAGSIALEDGLGRISNRKG